MCSPIYKAKAARRETPWLGLWRLLTQKLVKQQLAGRRCQHLQHVTVASTAMVMCWPCCWLATRIGVRHRHEGTYEHSCVRKSHWMLSPHQGKVTLLCESRLRTHYKIVYVYCMQSSNSCIRLNPLLAVVLCTLTGILKRLYIQSSCIRMSHCDTAAVL